MSLIIPVFSKRINLINELTKIVPDVTFHEVKCPDKDAHFRNSEIVICDFDYLEGQLYNLPKVKWVQGTWAGVDNLIPLIDKNNPLPYQITRFTGKHFGRIMSEYVITNIVNFERDLFKVKENQMRNEWSTEGCIGNYRAIFDLTIGILGIGNIGSRIGNMLHNFGATVYAFGRRPELPSGEKYNFISKYYTRDTLPVLLKECDYIVNVLPSVEATNNLLDGDILENCKDKGGVLINIGRGNIISENALVKALTNKWLSGAILDVFSKEPLVQDSCLWQLPQVVITPHVAGNSRSQDIAEQFRYNFLLYQKKLPLPGALDITKGY